MSYDEEKKLMNLAIASYRNNKVDEAEQMFRVGLSMPTLSTLS